MWNMIRGEARPRLPALSVALDWPSVAIKTGRGGYEAWNRVLARGVLLGALGFLPATSIAQFIKLTPAAPVPASQAPEEESESEAPPSDAVENEAAPATSAPASAPAGKAAPTKEEIAAIRAQYDALPKDRQDEMKAYYKDVGLDLDALLGLSAAASADAMRVQQVLDGMRDLDFSRTPQNVLAARAKIGFGQVAHPNPATARGLDMARWIHLQVMAGEWDVFRAFLDSRPKAEAQRIYSQILQSVNRGNAGLLPEEVLALAEACPEEPKSWQTTAWANLLKNAAEKNSPRTMLARIGSETKYFGKSDAQRRRRTVDLLAAGGLVAQAYEFLPGLDEARAAGDGDLILVHALYQADLAKGEGAEQSAEGYRAAAWELFCEASLAPRASLPTKREAIKQNIALMSRMPRSRVNPWLQRVFADDALGPAALETIALSAVSVGEAKQQQNEEARAQAILTLKEAVDVLLERRDVDQSALRVPMRMLTTALVSEMENAVAQKGQKRAVAREAQLLIRAIPSKTWFDALEPSLATRADKACIGVATIADETDMALGLLADAVRRTPDQALAIADGFLKVWESRLSPKSDVDEDTMIYYFWREYIAQAPLTRGRQRRNLERLGLLMKTLSDVGVDYRALPSLASAFKACHGITEVYDRAEIERVFGPIGQIPAATAGALAQTMAASLNGDWRNRAVQQKQGVKRTDTEIAQLVDKGYGIALELIDGALARQPESWRFAVAKAGLSYDRMQFRRSQNKASETAKDAEYRTAAFAAFEQAAQRYAKAIAAGEEREDVGVFERWFGAAMGTSQLNFLKADDLPEDGTPQDDQIDRIRKAIAALPADAAFRHISAFSRAVSTAVARQDPEVKPRLVRHALRIVGDHPAGAELRALNELYRDLVKDEIKLRLALDGDDRVGVNRQFGLLVALRFTNSVDRETGGFSKYLQTNAYVRVGRQYQEVNFREKLQKNIETTLSKGFVVESIGFFDPFMPAQGVLESGQDGWLEKPLAYVILARTDPTVDRIPQLTMDMQFEDQTGPVTLVLPSNAPAVAVGGIGEVSTLLRPCPELQVTQVVDPRDARDGEKDRSIKLEVIGRGKGAIPDLREMLAGLENAVAGYRIEEKGIEAKPTVVMQDSAAVTARYYWGPPKEPEGGYPQRDETGMYRLRVERSWVVTYSPVSASAATVFRVPRLKDGVKAGLTSRYFSDFDLVPVVGERVSVERASILGRIVAVVVLLLMVGSIFYAYRRMRRPVAVEAAAFGLPARITPLSAVMALRRMAQEHGNGLSERRAELERDIALIEMKYFGPGENPEHNGDLHDLLRRWSTSVRAESSART